jgi:hypothetical protein
MKNDDIRVSTTKSGEKRYQVQIRLKGFDRVTKTFKRKSDAKKWKQLTEVSMLEGRYFETSRSRKHTVGQLIDKYVNDVLLEPKSNLSESQKRNQVYQFLAWKNEIGHLLVFDLAKDKLRNTIELFSQVLTPKGTQRSPATINRYIAALTTAFNYANRELDWCQKDHPVIKIQIV